MRSRKRGSECVAENVMPIVAALIVVCHLIGVGKMSWEAIVRIIAMRLIVSFSG